MIRVLVEFTIDSNDIRESVWLLEDALSTTGVDQDSFLIEDAEYEVLSVDLS